MEITLTYFGITNSGRHLYGNSEYVAALKEELKDGDTLVVAGATEDGKQHWLRRGISTVKVKIA